MTLTNCRGKNEHNVRLHSSGNCTCCSSIIQFKRSFSGLLSALSVVISHTVNLLSALPLQCLDVLLMVPVGPGSEQCLGVNMDCVHTLVLFMERRLELVKQRAEA